MMKWVGKKPSPSSSSSSSSSAFSWLSKLKHIRINSDSNHEKIKHKEKQISPPSCFDIGGKYGNKNGRRKSQSTIKLKEKDIIGLEDERKIVNDKKDYDREMEYENMRRRFERKAQQVLEEQLLKLEKEAKEVEEKNVMFQDESPRTICTPRTTHSFGSSRLRNVRENRFEKSEIESSQRKQSYDDDDEKKSFLKQNEELKKIKIQEKQRRKIKKVSRVKIYSPRMVSKVEISRIKALEEMRNKAKQKMKKEEMKEEIMEEIISTNPELDSFAVIKCSLNPKQDFRDSMIEMIEEKHISKAEEMEELLACYLTLNADEYHDLIIKVFRQVWFDMSQYGFGISSEMQWGYYE